MGSRLGSRRAEAYPVTRRKPLLIHLWDFMVKFRLPLRQGKWNGKGRAFIEMLYPLIDVWTSPSPNGECYEAFPQTAHVENMVPGCWRKPDLGVSLWGGTSCPWTHSCCAVSFCYLTTRKGPTFFLCTLLSTEPAIMAPLTVGWSLCITSLK